MLWLAAVSGLLVGLTLATLGGGGSILTVPILVYVLGQDPHAATTGSLLIVAATALAGTLAHARAGRVRVGQGIVFAVAGIPGAIVGARLSAGVDGNVLLIAFAALTLTAAIAMLSRWWRERRQGPTQTGNRGARRRSPALMVATATGVGLLTGFLGVGGGFLVVPALALVLAMSMPEAIGTSLLVITITSTAALATRIGQPTTMDWPVLAGFAGAAILAALAGGRLVGRLRPARLTVGFAALLLAVSAYTAAQSLPALL